MSKYQPLWQYVVEQKQDHLELSFATIASILGFPMDYTILKDKQELVSFGYELTKILLKTETVLFNRSKSK